jgi:cytoskeletal protein CcmA (bactofilin family)
VSGEVIASDLLWIGRSARVDARIAAPEIVIAGEFDGEAQASGRIELRGTARVRATLDTGNLILAEGSFFEGRCRTRPESEPDAGA